ncbi:MAG: Restriction of telomere capping protein 5 [Cirrosporium novae-zelandiae]|nr:MAG: Restriction of telomere capping protein 5 [Cirrosporium novae-zelandiae]
MGQTISGEDASRTVSTEELSYELSSRFAHRCFTPLELTHFRDNFRSLADEQNGIRYWKEDTLYRFLVIPDALGPGPVIYQMTTYLGAFPFPSLAPSILTFEALIKVVVIMTERYEKVLKRGKSDRNKLLFRSLAVYDRHSSISTTEKLPELDKGEEKGQPEVNDAGSAEGAVEEIRSHVAGFTIDEPANDDEEDEDDDELALSALESLDAIEVFKHDHRADTKIHHAQIPADNFRRLLMMLLVIAPLGPQENLAKLAEGLTDERMASLRKVADSIIWSFNIEQTAGINYRAFNALIPTSLPYLFNGLSPLFEHFLFSKNIDLSRHRATSTASSNPPPSPLPPPSPSIPPLDSDILDPPTLSQLSFFFPSDIVFNRLRPLYSASKSGFSLNSLSQKLFHWKAPTLLLVSGTRLPANPTTPRERTFADSLPHSRLSPSPSANSNHVIFGAYLTTSWKATPKTPLVDSDALLFQLSPYHDIFPSSISTHLSTATFSTILGLSFGCAVPKTSPSNTHPQPLLGPVSLHVDPALDFAVFTHDASSSPTSSFRPSSSPVRARRGDWQERFEIDSFEVWGIGGEEEEVRMHRDTKWEEREAARRRGINSTGDVEADKALLELAGIIGGGRSGGSMG